MTSMKDIEAYTVYLANSHTYLSREGYVERLASQFFPNAPYKYVKGFFKRIERPDGINNRFMYKYICKPDINLKNLYTTLGYNFTTYNDIYEIETEQLKDLMLKIGRTDLHVLYIFMETCYDQYHIYSDLLDEEFENRGMMDDLNRMKLSKK